MLCACSDALAVWRAGIATVPILAYMFKILTPQGRFLRMSNTVLTLLSAAQLREFYARGFWRDETIYGAVRAHAAKGPNACAMRDRWRRFTYARVAEAADRLAADLDARGLRAGDRVAVWLPSRIEAAVVLLAC